MFRKSVLQQPLRRLGQILCCALLLAGAEAQALDPRFSDADGDMIADIPTDPKEWVDPATLVFTYTPVEDPAVYAKVWDGFIQHMEKVTGKKVQFFPVQSNAAQLEAMRAGRLQLPALTPAPTLWRSTAPVFGRLR